MRELFLCIQKEEFGIGSIVTRQLQIPEEKDWFEMINIGYQLPILEGEKLLGMFRTREEAWQCRENYVLGFFKTDDNKIDLNKQEMNELIKFYGNTKLS